MYFSCEFQAGRFPNSFSSVHSLFPNDIYSWSMWDAVRGNEQVVMQLMCEGLVCIPMGHWWPATWYVPSWDEIRGVQSSRRIFGKCYFWFMYCRFSNYSFVSFSFPREIQWMFSFEKVRSKCILKLPWIGLQALKYIFGKAGYSQTLK